MNPWEQDWGTTEAAPWEQNWQDTPVAETPDEYTVASESDGERVLTRRGEPGVEYVIRGGSTYKRNAFTGAEAPIIGGVLPRSNPVTAAIASGVANLPGAATGMAAAGYAANNPLVQRLPPLGRGAVTIGAGALGAISGSLAARPTAERLIPELASLEQENPVASAVGANLAQGPFSRLGAGLRLAERGLGAGIGAGFEGASQIVSGEFDPSLIGVGALGGAAFTDPTRTGKSLMDLGASVNKKPITTKLGNASTKDNYTEALAASNDIALSDTSAPQRPMPDVMSLAALSPQEGPAGAPGAIGSVGDDDFGPLAGPRKPKLSRVRGLDVDPVRGTPDDGPTPFEIPTGQEEVQLKEPMVFERAIGGPNPEAQVAVQEAFNKRVKNVTENLAEQGVQIDRQTAVKLARITKADEFNAARQQLIDSVGGEVVEVPKKGPIKSLEELPAKIGQDEAVMPEPTEEVAPNVDTPRAREEAPDVMAKRLSSEADPIALQKDVERYNEIQGMLKTSLDYAKANPTPENREAASKLLMDLWPENETIKNRYGGMPPVAPEAPVKAVSEPIKAPEPVKSPETPVVEQNPVKPTEQATAAKPASPLKPEVIESPLLKPKRAKKVAVDDDAAIEAAAAEQAGRAEPAPQAKAPTIPKGADTTSVKTKDGLKTIYKDPKDGNWYDAQRNMLSGGSRQVAIDKVKKGGVQKAGKAGIIYNPFDTGTEGRRLSQLNRIDFEVHGDGTYSVDGFSQSGVRSSRPAKYGKTETPQISFRGTEEELRRAFGDAVADKIVKEANSRIFNDAPDSFGDKSDVVVTGRIEGLNSADFKSKFGTQAGSVLNPFDGEPSALGRRALEVANEPLLRRMAEAEVQTAPETTTAPTPEVTFPKPGEGRSQSQAEKRALETTVYDDSGLKPITDSITGKPIPENIKENAKIIYERLKSGSKENTAPEPTKALADDIAATEEYRPGLTDLSTRFPWTGKIGLSQTVGAFAKAARKVLGTVQGNIRSASPRVAGALREKVADLNEMRLDFLARSDSLGKLSRKNLTKEEFNELDAANLSGDRSRAEQIFKGKPQEQELLQAYDSHQEVMREALELERELGREVGEVENYFRRSLIDRDGLLKAMGKEGENTYKDLLNVERKKGPLTKEDEDRILNNFIAGSSRNRGGAGWLKPRTIETIEQNLLKYYEPFDVATHDYVMSVTRDISNRRFLGKTSEDGQPFDGNIGKIINEEVKSGKLGRKGFDLVQKNLKDYLTNSSQYDRELTTWANRARKIQTYAYLADVGSAIIQGGEYFNTALKYGFGKATASLGDAKRFTLKDLNVFEPNQDLVTMRRSRGSEGPARRVLHEGERAYQWAMKNFIQRADEYMTGVTASAAWRYASDVAGKPNSDQFKALNETYSKAFPERWPKILEGLKSEDFRKGKLSPDTAFFLFNEVANLKPLDASDRAQGYNAANPWFKLLYSLRTYPIKQLDVMREIGYERMKQGGTRNAIAGTARLAAYAAVIGAGQQSMSYLRDLLFDRAPQGTPEEVVSEYAITGMLQLGMIPRYAFYKAKQDGLPEAVISTVVPGLSLLNDMWKDTQTTAKMVTGQRDSSGFRTVEDLEDFFKQTRMVQYAPAVGRPAYWWFGRGAEAEKKAESDRLEGKTKTGTLQTISEMLIPPDTKSPRKD